MRCGRLARAMETRGQGTEIVVEFLATDCRSIRIRSRLGADEADGLEKELWERAVRAFLTVDQGLLVAPSGRGRGYLRLTVRRPEAMDGDSEVTATVSSEVVNFYALLAGWGWFARIGRVIYNETQLRIHIVVTSAFLRSLANLDLEQSAIGALRGAANPDAPQRSPAASPGRGER